jgi:hypothetical protein
MENNDKVTQHETNPALLNLIQAAKAWGVNTAKTELLNRIEGIHNPSEIAAEVLLWIRETDEPKKAEK